jgi:hypothetical protein
MSIAIIETEGGSEVAKSVVAQLRQLLQKL